MTERTHETVGEQNAIRKPRFNSGVCAVKAFRYANREQRNPTELLPLNALLEDAFEAGAKWAWRQALFEAQNIEHFEVDKDAK